MPINISDIKELIEQIRLYRNSVAHFKFFYKAEYDECNRCVNRLNSAVIKAINITENKDFAEKNAETLSETLKDILAGFASFTKSLAEMAQKMITTVIAPAFTAISKAVQESTWIKSLGNFAVNAVLAEEARKRQELFEAIKPSTALVQGIVPSYVNETQSLLNSIRMETTMPNLPKIDIPKYDIPKIDIDIPKIDLGLDTSSPDEDTEIHESEDDNNAEKY